jgi:hypothetical protein
MSCKFLEETPLQKKCQRPSTKWAFYFPNSTQQENHNLQTKVANGFHGDTLQLGKSIN